MKNFEEIQSELIQRAKKANACNEELTKLKKSTTIEEIIEIGKNNVNFLSQKMGLNAQNITEIVDKSLLGELLTGVDNVGFWNTGDSNTGHRNTGIFNRDTPKLRFFEKESNWTYSDWYNSKAYSASCKFLLTEWIPETQMTDKEK